MKYRLLRLMLGCLVSLLIAASLSGCHQSRPITLNLFIDGSDRTPEHLYQELDAAYRCNQALAPNDQLNIFLFGHGCQHVYGATKCYSRREFYSKFIAKLEDGQDTLWTAGTLSDNVLDDASGRVANRPTVCVLIGDGGFEDHSRACTRRLALSIKHLAANAKLSGVLMVGVAPEWRESWEKSLQPLGEGRFAVCGFGDYMSALLAAVDVAHAKETGR